LEASDHPSNCHFQITTGNSELISHEQPISYLYYLIATAALECRDFPKAAAAFSQIFSQTGSLDLPRNLDVVRMHHEYAFALLSSRRFEICISVCNRVLQLVVGDALALLYKADALLQLNQVQEAIECLREGLLQATDAAKIASADCLYQTLVNNLALLLVCNGDCKQAQETLSPFIQGTSDKQSPLKDSLGRCLTFNYCAIAVQRSQGTEASACWFSVNKIPLDQPKHFYQSLLTSHLKYVRPLHSHRNRNPQMHRYRMGGIWREGQRACEPSLFQESLMTEICLRHWLSLPSNQAELAAKQWNILR
jgi:tetratricopeptide (TPR) repeat protein